MDYITEKLRPYGVTPFDMVAVQTLCDDMTTDERDILDCMHNLGVDTSMSEQYKATELALRERFTRPYLELLGAYVSARRNVEEY